jgi:hypothetical protein
VRKAAVPGDALRESWQAIEQWCSMPDTGGRRKGKAGPSTSVGRSG